jgi:iron complex outermembrane recepter protein
MRLHRIALAVSMAFPVSFTVSFTVGIAPAWAQGVATEAQLRPVTVTESRSADLDPNLPSNSASKTAQDLESQNIFNAEDAFRYMPSTTVRKRYFGDRNANIGGRSFGVLEPGRALVYLDGYLISQFLGRFDAPRWQMVNNESIERVDVLYGPFSAIYPGNSIGTTLSITERKPKGLEASASIKYNSQDFKEYGTNDTYRGTMTSARLANRLDTGLWGSLGVQHQDVTGHPMGYANVLRGAAGQFGAPNAGTAVNGIVRDIDSNGVDRAIFAANSIDHVVQDSLNMRVGYDISATQEVEARLSFWKSKSDVRVDNYLRNAATGAAVWSGVVNDGVNSFNLNSIASSFSPSQRDEENRQVGLTWKTKHATGWNASVVATQYDVVNDVNRSTSLIQPIADNGGVGLATRRDGTGWNTFEVQTTYTPSAGDFGNGRHALTFGVHRNQYKLINSVRDATDWRTNETTQNQRYSGETEITALYGQDAWKVTPTVVATLGVRLEAFRQLNGRQFDKSLPAATRNQTFADRDLTASSPKLSVAWAAQDDLLIKTSLGQGTRFPNVDEMFNGTKTSTNTLINNPNLRPEKSTALELSAEKMWDASTLRVSLFRDDVKDAILRQTDSTITPSTTLNTNVERVLTTGVELVWQARDVGIKGFDLGGSATWADSKIMENTLAPKTEGNYWLRIPQQRYVVQASYRPNEQWTFGANYRLAGRNYNTATNTDSNPNTFGGISSVNQLDLRMDWKFAKNWNWALGIDNVTASQAWQAHSLPQRSVQTEIRYSMQ